MVATVTPSNLGSAFDIGVAVPSKITLTPDAVSQSGVGAPTFTPPAGSSPFYVDKNTTPYNLYWYDGLAWHLVGSAPAGAADGTVTAAALSVAKVLSLTRSVGAPVTVDLSALSGGGAGEANTTSNTGTGIGLASPKVGVNLPVKSIKAGAGVTVVDNGLDVTIASTVTGGAADGNISNVALSGTNLTFTGTNGGFNGAVSLAAIAATSSFVANMGMFWFSTIASIPAGWHICDGTAGTPDLRDRFIVGAGGTYAVGTAVGSATAVVDPHALTLAEMPAHSHGNGVVHNSAAIFAHGVQFVPAQGGRADFNGGGGSLEGLTTTEGSGAAHTHTMAAGSNLPPSLAYPIIMKV